MVFTKTMGLVVIIKNLLLDTLDLFFPNFCILCDQKIYRTFNSICEKCLDKIEMSTQFEREEFFKNNLQQSGLIENYYAKYEFVKNGLLQKAVHNLKYNRKSRIGLQLGIELGKDLLEQPWFTEIDFIVPLPIHRIKKLSRGYNQSDFIAKGISIITSKPVQKRLIKRIKNTRTQTRLNLDQRIDNVKNAFKVIDRKMLNNKCILIVDDVCTTGSTVNEVARTLLNAGAKKIFLSTLAFVKEIDFNLKV